MSLLIGSVCCAIASHAHSYCGAQFPHHMQGRSTFRIRHAWAQFPWQRKPRKPRLSPTLRGMTAGGPSVTRDTRISTSAVHDRRSVVPTAKFTGAWPSFRRGRATNKARRSSLTVAPLSTISRHWRCSWSKAWQRVGRRRPSSTANTPKPLHWRATLGPRQVELPSPNASSAVSPTALRASSHHQNP